MVMFCQGLQLFFGSQCPAIDGGNRSMVTLCSHFSVTTTLLVRVSAYDDTLLFRLDNTSLPIRWSCRLGLSARRTLSTFWGNFPVERHQGQMDSHMPCLDVLQNHWRRLC